MSRTLTLRADDKAGLQYWDSGYKQRPGKAFFNPHSRELRAFWKRGLHQYFIEVLDDSRRGQLLLEVGCGDSRMLSYFAREFGFVVTGIDYSESGCDRARLNLAEENVSGTVCCADLFSPPAELLHRFDLVVSFGVIEHFSDTVSCIRALKDLLKPGGAVITIVPNLAGLYGTCQRLLDGKVFDMHVPLGSEMLARAHADAGLRITRCDYLLFVNFAILNINRIRPGTARYWTSLMILRALRGLTAAAWALESVFRLGPPNRFTSPYLACAATYDIHGNTATNAD